MVNIARLAAAGLVAASGAVGCLAAMSFAPMAYAQVNLIGVWSARAHEDFEDRIPGPMLGDYTGVPINEANRLRAQTWSASILSLPDYQCRVHPADYANMFNDIRITEDIDKETQQLIAIRLQHFAWNTQRVFWMDGREHPPEHALHTGMGFSTAEWEGHILKVTTTHLREGFIRRNGIARSDRATVTEHFIRHGNYLNWAVYTEDPAYLEEGYFRNRDYVYNETARLGAYPCESVIEVVLPRGYFTHYLPGQNRYLYDFAREHRIPFEAAMGGARTLYPEYRRRLRELPLVNGAE
jgi:hypothetical protein